MGRHLYKILILFNKHFKTYYKNELLYLIINIMRIRLTIYLINYLIKFLFLNAFKFQIHFLNLILINFHQLNYS